jgi:hypothetical protein
MFTLANMGLGRYIFPIFPQISLLLIAFVYYLLYCYSRKAAAGLLALFCVAINVLDVDNRNIRNTFKDYLPNSYALLEDYSDYSAIVLNGGFTNNLKTPIVYGLSRFKRVFLCGSDESFVTALGDVSAGENLVLYIPDVGDIEEALDVMRDILPFRDVGILFYERTSTVGDGHRAFVIEW